MVCLVALQRLCLHSLKCRFLVCLVAVFIFPLNPFEIRLHLQIPVLVAVVALQRLWCIALVSDLVALLLDARKPNLGGLQLALDFVQLLPLAADLCVLKGRRELHDLLLPRQELGLHGVQFGGPGACLLCRGCVRVLPVSWLVCRSVRAAPGSSRGLPRGHMGASFCGVLCLDPMPPQHVHCSMAAVVVQHRPKCILSQINAVSSAAAEVVGAIAVTPVVEAHTLIKLHTVPQLSCIVERRANSALMSLRFASQYNYSLVVRVICIDAVLLTVCSSVVSARITLRVLAHECLVLV